MKYQTNGLFQLRDIAGDSVLFRNESNIQVDSFAIVLNETGALLWNAMHEPCAIEELVNIISTRFQVDETTAQQDVSCFIQKCLAEGMIIQL